MNWSYIAGFLDADGYICFNKQHKSYWVGIGQKTNKVLEEIRKFIGVGSVYKELREDGGNYYRLLIYKKKEVNLFLKEIFPYLFNKKRTAKRAIKRNSVS